MRLCVPCARDFGIKRIDFDGFRTTGAALKAARRDVQAHTKRTHGRTKDGGTMKRNVRPVKGWVEGRCFACDRRAMISAEIAMTAILRCTRCHESQTAREFLTGRRHQPASPARRAKARAP